MNRRMDQWHNQVGSIHKCHSLSTPKPNWSDTEKTPQCQIGTARAAGAGLWRQVKVSCCAMSRRLLFSVWIWAAVNEGNSVAAAESMFFSPALHAREADLDIPGRKLLLHLWATARRGNALGQSTIVTASSASTGGTIGPNFKTLFWKSNACIMTHSRPSSAALPSFARWLTVVTCIYDCTVFNCCHF